MQLNLSRHALDTFDGCKHLTPYVAANRPNDALHTPTVMQITHLDLSFNTLRAFAGFEDLPHLRVLNLSHNILCSLEGELPPGLSNLNISYNKLSTLQPGALRPLRKLQALDISFNCLKDLRGLPNVPNALRVLNACSNKLENLTDIEQCPCLEELYMNKNALKEAQELSGLAKLTRLRVLTLSENPILLFPEKAQTIPTLLPPDLEQTDVPGVNEVYGANASPQSATPPVSPLESQSDGVDKKDGSRDNVGLLVPVSNPQGESQPHILSDTQHGAQCYLSQCLHDDVARVGASEAPVNGTSRVSMDSNALSCSQEGMRKVQVGCRGPQAAREGVAQEPHPNTRGSLQMGGEACQRVYKQVMAERDAYRQQVQDMQKEVHDLKRLLEEQREAAVAMLRINEHLEKRVQHALTKPGRCERATQYDAPPKVDWTPPTEGTDPASRQDFNVQKRPHAATVVMASPPASIPPLAPQLLPRASTPRGRSPVEDTASRSISQPRTGERRQQPRSWSASERTSDGSLRLATLAENRVMSPSPTSPWKDNEAQMVRQEEGQTDGGLDRRTGPSDWQSTREGSSGMHSEQPQRSRRGVATALMSLLRPPGPSPPEFL